MKRIFFVVFILLAISTVLYAQQGRPRMSSAEARQAAQGYLPQTRANAAEFEAKIAELKARNMGYRDVDIFLFLRSELSRLEGQINLESSRVEARFDNGQGVSTALLDRLDALVVQYRARLNELEAFAAR